MADGSNRDDATLKSRRGRLSKLQKAVFSLVLLLVPILMACFLWATSDSDQKPSIHIEPANLMDQSVVVTITNSTRHKIYLRPGFGLFGLFKPPAFVYNSVEKRTASGWTLEAKGRDPSEILYAFTEKNSLAPGQVLSGRIIVPDKTVTRRIIVYWKKAPTRWPSFLLGIRNRLWRKIGAQPESFNRLESKEYKLDNDNDRQFSEKQLQREFEAAAKRIHQSDITTPPPIAPTISFSNYATFRP